MFGVIALRYALCSMRVPLFTGVKDMKGSQLKRGELAGPNRKTGLELMDGIRQS